MNRLTITTTACLTLTLLFTPYQTLPAKKPGSSPGENGGGKIFLRFKGDHYWMNDDGSDLTLMPQIIGVFNKPSQDPHNGKWWFPDQFFNGAFEEIVVISETGDFVSVAAFENIELLSQIRWGIGDSFVSWIGREWDLDPSSASFGQPIDGGVYATTLVYDENGDIIGGDETMLVVPVPLALDPNSTSTDARPDIRSHDWSPDGTRMVFVDLEGAMKIADLATLQISTVFSSGINGYATSPHWSPAGDKILFAGQPPLQGARSGLQVCNVDGSEIIMIQQWRSTRHGEWACWSPTGSHLVYRSKDHLLDNTFLVRVQADGSDAQRITDREYGSGYDAVLPIGWR